jgi:hypothetical protein
MCWGSRSEKKVGEVDGLKSRRKIISSSKRRKDWAKHTVLSLLRCLGCWGGPVQGWLLMRQLVPREYVDPCLTFLYRVFRVLFGASRHVKDKATRRRSQFLSILCVVFEIMYLVVVIWDPSLIECTLAGILIMVLSCILAFSLLWMMTYSFISYSFFFFSIAFIGLSSLIHPVPHPIYHNHQVGVHIWYNNLEPLHGRVCHRNFMSISIWQIRVLD